MEVRVNFGHRDYGYFPVSKNPNDLILYHMEDIPPKSKYDKLFKVGTGLAVLAFTLVELICPETGFAKTVTGGIDITPLEKFFMEVYWTMLKVVLYLSIPIYSWIGYVLVFAGSSTEKRSSAKGLAIWTTIGIGVVAGAPWVARAIYNLWIRIFA